jgi:hypothetical protein
MARLPMSPMNQGPSSGIPMDMPAGPPMDMPAGPGAPSIQGAVGPEGATAMLAPDEGIQIVLLARMESLSPAELQTLDNAIDGKTASVLLKLLPELGQLIDAYTSPGRGAEAGALANM